MRSNSSKSEGWGGHFHISLRTDRQTRTKGEVDGEEKSLLPRYEPSFHDKP